MSTPTPSRTARYVTELRAFCAQGWHELPEILAVGTVFLIVPVLLLAVILGVASTCIWLALVLR